MTRADQRDELARILDLLTEVRARWSLFDDELRQLLTTAPGTSDQCSLGDDVVAAAAHVRAGLLRLDDQIAEADYRRG